MLRTLPASRYWSHCIIFISAIIVLVILIKVIIKVYSTSTLIVEQNRIIRDEKVAEVWKKGIRKLTNNNKINNICPMQVFG